MLLHPISMMKFITSGSEPTGPSDNFDDNSIASFWTPVTASTSSIVETGGQLVITAPNDINYDWYGVRNAPRLEQDFSPGSSAWNITVDFSASAGGSGPSAATQGHGIIIFADDNNNIRFDTYHNGTNLYGFCANITGGSPSTQFNNIITSTHWRYLRVERSASEGQWRFYGSPDGVSYTTAGSGFTRSLTVTKMAIFASRGSTAGQYVANIEDITFG